MARFNQFNGIRNTVPPQQISAGGENGTDLAAAVNVDVNDAKRLKRRAGSASFSAGAADSLFSDGVTALFRRGNALRQLLDDGSDVVLRSGVNNRIAYGEANGAIFWSDGVVNGRVDNGVDGPWGVEVPDRQPDYAAAVGGNLPRGRYLYAVTYLRDGEESGTGPSGETAEIEGTIEFSNVPVPSDADGKALYISRPNGQELYRVLTLPVSATTASYSGDTTDLSVRLETQFKQPPPPTSIIAEHYGRMLLGVGRHLVYSDAYRPGLYDPVRQAYTFASAVTLIAPVRNGVYVGTETEIVWLAGNDVSAASRSRLAGYGAIPGTLDYTEAQNVGGSEANALAAIFASQRGICVGLPDGGFSNMTLNRYAYPRASRGAGVVRIEDGKNRYIATMRR